VSDLLRDLFAFVNHVVLGYFVLVVAGYTAITLLSYVQARRHRRRLVHARLQRSVRSSLTPPIAVCVPCLDEEAVLVDCVRALLGLRYPQHEVVVANDGSTDRSLALLIEAFALRRVDDPAPAPLPTRPIRGVYRSRTHPNLTVIDKENGGRSDALNAAINHARHPLVCCTDADSLLEPEALLTLVRPFVERPERTVAAGGMIRVANGATVERGHVVRADLPREVLPMFQVVEYLRAFTAARCGWSMVNGLLIISGAFGLFRKDAVIDVGGYAVDSVGEDFELSVRLHSRMRELGRPHHLAFVPDPVCWTQAPSRLRDLGGQRDRWHRGLTDTLWRHRRLIGNPRMGSAGLIALPFFVLFELVGAFVEAAGYLVVVLGLVLGLVNAPFAILFFSLAVLTGVVLSFSALLLEDATFRRFHGARQFLRLALFCTLENFGYRQLMTFYRVRGFVSWLRGDHSWGTIERTVFEGGAGGLPREVG
jgi:cellulose synthase/poly-beta-1,6-N-acetylglucosamine synthase-like glycosyltransferase